MTTALATREVTPVARRYPVEENFSKYEYFIFDFIFPLDAIRIENFFHSERHSGEPNFAYRFIRMAQDERCTGLWDRPRSLCTAGKPADVLATPYSLCTTDKPADVSATPDSLRTGKPADA